MGMSPSKERTTLSEINVTPLVDVMLVLLIIFMVTAPMMQQGIDVKLPETTNTGLTVKEDPFVIVVKEGEKIYIDKQEFTSSGLRQKLTAIFATRKSKEVYLQADKSVSYGFVAQVMAEIKASGISGIGLVTLPKN
jgi:biopolymer transport protein TolR